MEAPKKAESEKTEEFTKRGKCNDEITFIFDDGKELYVSENFLNYASPVFQAMFENDWKEKEPKNVKLPEKSYDNFLEFLLCLHPNKQKPVDKENVLRICAIAEEYQSALIVHKCKGAMLNWLSTEMKRLSSTTSHDIMASTTRTCLQVLIAAESLHYEEVVVKTVSSVAQCGYKWFTGTPKSCSNEEKIEETLKECKTLFDSLSDTLKVRVLSERLNTLDKSKYHG